MKSFNSKLYNLKYASKHLRAAAAATTSLTRHSMLILSAQTSFLHLVHAYLFREKLEIHIVLHQLERLQSQPASFFHEFFFNAYLKAAEGGQKSQPPGLACA